MTKKALIKTSYLKDFLSLFDKETVLNDFELGDIWHPSSGYIDESIFNGENKIKDILGFDYDFKGLVAFEANIEEISIIFKSEVFEITGSECAVRRVKDRVVELNTYTPEKYQFTYIEYYE